MYALAVLFAAYTGVRAAELQGLQVGDVTLPDIPGTVGAVRVRRTATKRQGEWIAGTPKTAKSDRVVPLATWLADDLRDYLTTVHPFSAMSTQGQRYIAHAPLFPGKRTRAGSTAVEVADFNWAGGQGGLEVVVVQVEHYMQVSKWLGHSSYVLTLSTYADYIREDDTAAPKFGRPVAQSANNVVSFASKRSS
ncbi:hypothetical protein A5636_18540 [Mycobacterium asiaticum]|uniref:Uncharacterized protein n=1 Tax=Mycobacterium asiaticum TaxID=1790 RepID=A0A1A3NG65_MYCAS|nr:hypothetical protein A5636_18540 [Mycobacterium asiaticum]